MKIKFLISIPLFLLFTTAVIAQYSCATSVVVPGIPYSASNLTTSSGPSYGASEFCGQNTNYFEQDYIFEYTPLVDESLTIAIQHNNFLQKAGIYVFTDCAQPPTECIGFSEAISSNIEFTFVATAGTGYFIFIGTQVSESFFIDITKEAVEGVAINKSEPTQTLDVNGSIRIGEGTTTPYEGTVRWNSESGEFEGYNGTGWMPFTQKKEFGKVQKVGSGNEVLNGNADDYFGNAVAISGEYAIVGSPGKFSSGPDREGKAYIFQRSGSLWLEVAAITASDGIDQALFGDAVSISGDFAIVGSPEYNINGEIDQGKAYVFHRSGSSWTEQQILYDNNGDGHDYFGSSVSIFGDYAVVGSYGHDTNNDAFRGKAYVYKRNGTSWIEQDQLVSSNGNAGDFFGGSVDISNDIIVVGAIFHTTSGNPAEGRAYVYKRTGTIWNEEVILSSSDGGSGDFFGNSVAISGDNIIVGSFKHNTTGNGEQGKAYIFTRSGTSWNQEAMLVASYGKIYDQFGVSVDIFGDYAVIGAGFHWTNGNSLQGKAYVFKRSGTNWMQQETLISYDGQVGDLFGNAVSISKDFIIVGARGKNIDGKSNQGKIYFF